MLPFHHIGFLAVYSHSQFYSSLPIFHLHTPHHLCVLHQMMDSSTQP